GSTLGSDTGTSRVATDFTQSVEPGIGTISTSRPSALNQPIFMATANAEPTPVVMVRAHVATRSGVWAAVAIGTDSASSTASDTIRIIERCPPGGERGTLPGCPSQIVGIFYRPPKGEPMAYRI